jgi:hypothetical protein
LEAEFPVLLREKHKEVWHKGLENDKLCRVVAVEVVGVDESFLTIFVPALSNLLWSRCVLQGRGLKERAAYILVADTRKQNVCSY